MFVYILIDGQLDILTLARGAGLRPLFEGYRFMLVFIKWILTDTEEKKTILTDTRA